MILYLTFNDMPSGIFYSQVTDVVKFIRSEFGTRIKLIAFISIRGYAGNRKKIKTELPDALVIPMVPGIRYWRLNRFALSLLVFFLKPVKIIGRSVMATQLALMTAGKKTKVIYDGRGAISAEWKEYKVINDPVMLAQISELEKQCVLQTHAAIIVSQALLNYWIKEYGYNKSSEVIIPCTINSGFETIQINEQLVSATRSAFGYVDQDVVLVYSGSVSGWQSFELLYNFISPLLKQSTHYKLLFFSDNDPHISRLQTEFPNQVNRKKLSPQQMPSHLIVGDYGILIREESITNQVASPVKFAEYLACGLKPILSDKLGDYSAFVINNKCGYLYSDVDDLTRVSIEQRLKLHELAITHFSKSGHRLSYQKIVSN